MPRQLAAILFSDIVGYTALMGKDSTKALELVRVSVSLQKPLVEKYNGKWLKEMGDGAMAQFVSALDAVQCAIEIQEQARAKLDAKLRIGIHLGDITIENGDIYGDGVNVASRLESICDPGGIYVSQSISRAIKGESIETINLGERHLKNVDDPVLVYAIQGVGLTVPTQVNRKVKPRVKPIYMFVAFIMVAGIIGAYFNLSEERPSLSELTIPGDKSLAVLPFANLSNATDQEYFSDGLTEDILDHIAKINGIRLVSNTSSKAFKGSSLTVPEIADKLNVAYVLEGSVRRSANQVKVVAQLIDAANDRHIWSESFDYELEDIFQVQKEIANRIASYLSISLTIEEMQDLETAPTQNVEAYDWYLKAKYHFFENQTLEGISEAMKMMKSSIQEDPNFVDALCYISSGHMAINNEDSAWYYLTLAMKQDPNHPLVNIIRGQMEEQENNNDLALTYYQKANLAKPHIANNPLGYLYLKLGHLDSALMFFRNHIKLDPWQSSNYTLIARIFLSVGMLDSAYKYLDQSLLEEGRYYAQAQLYQDYYMLTGEYDRGIDYYEKLLMVSDEGLQDLYNYQMAIFYVFKREWQEALRILTKSKTGFTDYYGLAMEKTGQQDSARLIFEQNMAKADADDFFRIARLSAMLNKQDSAFSALDLAVTAYLETGDFSNLATMEDNPFFDDVRDHQGFQEVLREFRNLRDSMRMTLTKENVIPSL